MITSLAILLLGSMSPSDLLTGKPASFERMSDLQIDEWLGYAGFYHAGNVYRCKGLSGPAAQAQKERHLGTDYPARRAKLSRLLKAKYRGRYRENGGFLAYAFVTDPDYCRKVRYVVTDMLRATALLERRLGAR